MNLRLFAAVAAGRSAGIVSRRLGRGGGTALPGLVAERIDPDLVAHLGARLGRGSVLITGTNGKTTATRILASILSEAGIRAVHNRSGSNLMRGLATTLLGSASVSSAPQRRGAKRGDPALGLFEVDEATLPAAAAALRPRALAFTNLFRDQLDRYGEVDTVAAMWREALAVTPGTATLVLNADDPSVAELALDWPGPVHWYGVDDPAFAVARAGASDARWCRACGGSFRYTRRYFAHVGFWRCAGCGRERPQPDTVARAIHLELDRATFTCDGLGELSLPISGLYNVSNALAAIGLARVLGVSGAAIGAGLAAATAAFGRQETIVLEGRELRLLLAKNPAGANQVVALLMALAAAEPGGSLNIAVPLNDRAADGHDVSWIWDVDFELLQGRVANTWTGGDRAEDMALRLKYAGWPEASGTFREPVDLLDAVLRGTRPGDRVFVIPTYTAMLELRAELAHRGAVAPFWDEG